MDIKQMFKNTVVSLTAWYFTKKALPYWIVLIGDCSIVLISMLLGHAFNRGAVDTVVNLGPMVGALCAYMVCFIAGFWLMRTYRGVLRYSSFIDLGRIAAAMGFGSAIVLLLRWYCGTDHYLAAVSAHDLLVGSLIATMLMSFVRIFMRLAFDFRYAQQERMHILIFGAKSGAASIAKNIRSEHRAPYYIEGFVCYQDDLVGHSLQGLPILDVREREKLYDYIKKHNVRAVLISPLMQDYFLDECQDVIQKFVSDGIKILMLPREQEWDGKSNLTHRMLHSVSVEDLLPRKKISVDLDAIGAMLKGKRILITGAAGSIGSEMVRQVAKFSPEVMVLVDQAETPMHDIRRMMANQFAYVKAHTIVGSISNQAHMERLFAEFRPEYVFHAAAYKHVPMMEDNPAMAVQNNVYGTRVIADLAVKYGTKKFVMISTDKAVNPTNVMGCSKRICEIYCQALNHAIEHQREDGAAVTITQHDGTPAATQFVTTRFGNVLGSNGSVIPIFKQQIEKGGPVTVTHPDIIRFFMLIPEACRLVLEAGTMGKGGEIFVFDMGEPVRIADLAQRMIDLMGAKDVKIVYSGLRDGEKLYEEVLSQGEDDKPTVHPKIKVAAVREYPYELALRNEVELYELSKTYDDMAIVKKMKEIVPEYKSQNSKYEELDK